MPIRVTNPNILISGTPGTGKTTTSEMLASRTGFQHINVGDLVKQKELHRGWDDEFQAFEIDEDKVCDELEETMTRGGVIVDHHEVEFFPERWFDLVVVLRTDNSLLYPRLEGRGYAQKKIQENIECEIMQVVLDQATESYREEIIWELSSNSVEEMERNVERIEEWIRKRRNSG
eukprot:CAMPEP_0196662936 /NCGR_PEP_ID=MMETSP1086-20130531/50904_1 /TAXON_ID=77921 /ORGANISM="Cyanoptyche  gloeocystis , Strain SAG4.97" /LENGTH=174 /DNA_ID=CAMNT_0041998569 /DNA_START=56 /DNA_END=580 /DNA_ORIENTATION=+